MNTSAHWMENRWNRLTNKMVDYVEAGQYPGFITLVWKGDGLVHNACIGWMDVEGQRPVQMDSIFRIYSMTKPITCAAMMMLFEEGRFLLDEPVSKYIPALAKMKVYTGRDKDGIHTVDAVRPITIRHLLTQSSGLGGYEEFLPEHPLQKEFETANLLSFRSMATRPLAETVERLAQMPLLAQPGEAHYYGMSHDVVGYLISLLSGMPFEAFLQERIFDPLGMSDTGFWLPQDKAGRLVALYTWDAEKDCLALQDTAADGTLLHPPLAALGGMGLVSTVEDYLRFARMLLNGGALDGARLLGSKTVSLMTSNHMRPDQMASGLDPLFPNRGEGYGLGVSVVLDRGAAGMVQSVGTFGWGGAAGTNVFIDPAEKMVGLLMTQVLNSPVDHSRFFQNLVYQAID